MSILKIYGSTMALIYRLNFNDDVMFMGQELEKLKSQYIIDHSEFVEQSTFDTIDVNIVRINIPFAKQTMIQLLNAYFYDGYMIQDGFYIDSDIIDLVEYLQINLKDVCNKIQKYAKKVDGHVSKKLVQYMDIETLMEYFDMLDSGVQYNLLVDYVNDKLKIKSNYAIFEITSDSSFPSTVIQNINFDVSKIKISSNNDAYDHTYSHSIDIKCSKQHKIVAESILKRCDDCIDDFNSDGETQIDVLKEDARNPFHTMDYIVFYVKKLKKSKVK